MSHLPVNYIKNCLLLLNTQPSPFAEQALPLSSAFPLFMFQETQCRNHFNSTDQKEEILFL